MLRGRRRAAWAPRTVNLLTVPGKPGAYLEGIDIGHRAIEVPIGLVGKNIGNLQKLKEDLAAWLVTDEPKELIFDDEADRTYFAVVDDTFDPDELVRMGQGTIRFVCPDPYKYGPEKEAIFPSDVVSLPYNGTAPGDPVFELEVLQPVTFALIQNQKNEYMLIGQPTDVTDTTYVKYERVFYSDCDSLSGWTTAAPGEIDGNIAGEMETNGTRFQAKSYGTGSSSSWHGPAIKTSLPEVLKDFRLTAFVSLYNKNIPAQVGRLEIYLLDENGNQVCKVAMKDVRQGQSLAWGEARAGTNDDGYFLINEYGDRPGVWNDFYGHLRIERIGNYWHAYFAMQDPDTKKHHTRRFAYWRDTDNKYTGNVAQVVVHHGQYGSLQPIEGGIYSINVFKINPDQLNEVPYLAQPGDRITIDSRGEGEILLNGEPIAKQKDFGGDFLKLYKGENILTVYPFGSFATKARYRERFW